MHHVMFFAFIYPTSCQTEMRQKAILKWGPRTYSNPREAGKNAWPRWHYPNEAPQTPIN